MAKIVIIGNGVAGVTAARMVRKRSNHQITLISGESQAFYSRPALMYIFMGHLTFEQTKPYEDWFWSKNRIDLVQGWVSNIEPETKSVALTDGRRLDYDKLVIATGSKSNFFGWPGQDLPGVQGLYDLKDLADMETNCRGVKQAVIIGGGLIGVEMAEMLRTRGIDVTFLVREETYWGNVLRREEGHLVARHIGEHGVALRTETELKEIRGDDDGRVNAVLTNRGDLIECQFVGITAGVHPNIEMVRETPIPTNRGVIVNAFLETSVDGVYAAGDCAEIQDEAGQSRVEQLWYTGKMQGEVLARTLCGDRTSYDRGIWFNSAKFFDIEYHTYGQLPGKAPEHERSFYWEHPDGKQCLRLTYHKDDRVLLGMNAFGIRYRHQIFERWLADGRDLRFVLENLELANFDPEFFKRFEPEIVASYNRTFPEETPLKPRPTRHWLWGKLPAVFQRRSA